MKPETRNPEHETRNLKPETRNTKPEKNITKHEHGARNTKHETRSPKQNKKETRITKRETRNPKNIHSMHETRNTKPVTANEKAPKLIRSSVQPYDLNPHPPTRFAQHRAALHFLRGRLSFRQSGKLETLNPEP